MTLTGAFWKQRWRLYTAELKHEQETFLVSMLQTAKMLKRWRLFCNGMMDADRQTDTDQQMDGWRKKMLVLGISVAKFAL